ncbi:hypothetical protein [Nocardiopsis oceani]
MKTFARRLAVVMAAAVSMSTISAVSSEDTAEAANVTFSSDGRLADGSRHIHIEINGHNAGRVQWSADPKAGGWKGDTLYVSDDRADGYSIYGRVNYSDGSGRGTVVSASTVGRSAPYTDRATNNIAENTEVTVAAYVYQGTTQQGHIYYNANS